MIILDTDHLSVFTYERDVRHDLLNARMEAATEPIACSIVSVEEVLRGWLSIIHRLRDVHRQLPAYLRLWHSPGFFFGNEHRLLRPVAQAFSESSFRR